MKEYTLKRMNMVCLVVLIITYSYHDRQPASSVKVDGLEKSNAVNLSDTSEGLIRDTLTYDDTLQVIIETRYSNDTLDVVDYREDKYSSPIVLGQEMSFLNKGKSSKILTPQVAYTDKKVISKRLLRAVQTPIYEVCVIKNEKTAYYIISGSDFCNGVECPEFTGIYSLSGDKIYEGLSIKEQKPSLGEIVREYKFNINKKNKCISVGALVRK